MARTQYIFIDYENVCVTDLSLLAGKDAFVFLILGHHQDKLPVKVTLFAQQHPHQLRIIQTKVVGRNALDFVLTFELGRQLAADPGGIFHIISKDTDFQSVVLHLTAEDRRIARHKSLAEIPIFRAPRSPADRLTHLIQHLRDGSSGNRPRSRAKLENLIRSAFGSETEPEFITKTIDRLLREKILSFNGTGKIEYTHAA
ncbi:MAG: PIN domain-containing protein [Verrucomicrobiota bacterium]